MPTTSNFGWTTPADTDLVKDGAAAIRTLGNGIDTSLVDLKGGTTGQILSKNSNTDLDYIWINNDQGDITAVTAGTGLTGGGTTGAVTLTNDMATTITAKGDLLVGTGNATYDNLAVGTNGYTLVADSSTSTGLKWASGGKVLQVVQGTSTTATTVSTTTLTDTSLSVSITPSSATSKVLIIVAQSVYSSRSDSDCYSKMALLRGATAILTTASNNAAGFATDGLAPSALKLRIYIPLMYLDSPNTTSATTYKTQGAPSFSTNSGQVVYQEASSPSHIIALEIGA